MKRKLGFTLVEMAVVVVVVGILATFAVPRFMNSRERSKAIEAFNYLATLQAAQERYHSRQGTYAQGIGDLDVELVAPRYFTQGTITREETGWSQTLTRAGSPVGYGSYTVVFTQDGFDASNSTIPDQISPMEPE